MRTTLGIILITVSGFFGFSQEPAASYTLEEAIAFALQNNYSVINAERDLTDAQKQKWEVIASGLPQISGEHIV